MNESFNKKVWVAVPLMLLVFLLSACNNNTKQQTHEHDEYTCPMHPQVLQGKPGTCPICGMDLVNKSNSGNEVPITEDLKDLIKPTNTSVVASIKTIHPETKTLPVNVTASGVISYDTRKTYSVPVRFGGRIEKLYLKYNYQPVKKGQIIMETYSPELVTAQRELLYLVNEHREHDEILERARQKLLLLGLTSAQIEKIITSGKESFAFPVLSPYTGYIVESTTSVPELPATNAAQPSSMGGGMNNKSGAGMQPSASMNATSSAPSLGSQFSVREGMYVATGQSLFKVVDNSRLWAELYFSASDGKQIRKGDSVELHVKGLNDAISSRVDFIQPFFSEGRQFLKVRTYLNDTKNILRIGQLVTAHVRQPRTRALWVPTVAVLDLGVQQIVFIKDKGTFTPYKIKTGLHSDGWIEIIEGLDKSSEIAVNAQYLVDSESFIKVMNP